MIEQLSSADADMISHMLSDYFAEYNAALGREYYKDEKTLMLKHVSQRLATPGPIHYFGIKKDGTLQGFINVFENTPAHQLELWCIVPGTLTVPEVAELIAHCKQHATQKGISKMIIEIGDHQESIRQAVDITQGWKINTNYVRNN